MFDTVCEVVEDGMLQPLGYVHVACAGAYFEAPVTADRIRAKAGDLAAEQAEDLERALRAEGEE